jgi:hypothetical protein
VKVMGRVTPIDLAQVAWRRTAQGWAAPCPACRRTTRILYVTATSALACPACSRR